MRLAKSLIATIFCLLFLSSLASANHIRFKAFDRIAKVASVEVDDDGSYFDQPDGEELSEMAEEVSAEGGSEDLWTDEESTEDGYFEGSDEDADEGAESPQEAPQEEAAESADPPAAEEASSEQCDGDSCGADQGESPQPEQPAEEVAAEETVAEEAVAEEPAAEGSASEIVDPEVDVGEESEEVRRIRAIIFKDVTSVSSPVACFLGGGVAAGKSFALRPHLSEWGVLPATNYAHIAADTILVNLDGWNSSNRCAALGLHTRSTVLQSQFFREALARRVNILYEGSLSHMKPMMERIQNATARRYTLNMVAATVPTLMAAERAIVRAHEDGKFIPLTDVVTSHVEFSRAAFAYMPYMNTSMIFETSDPTAPQLIIKDDHIVNVALLRDFQLKVTDREEDIAQAIPGRMYEPYRTLCDCDGISDPYVCSSSHPDDGSGSSKPWRITAIIFMAATAVLAGMLIYGAYKWRKEREEGPRDYQSMPA